MDLATWLELKQVSTIAFGNKIGRNPSLIQKYAYEDAIPRREIMMEIFLATDGAVTANDFYHLSDNIFKEKLAAIKKAKKEPEMEFCS